MNSIGALEIAAIVFVGLALLGPRELYRIARRLGQWTGQARRMSQEFMRELTREADMEDLRQEWTKTKEEITSIGSNLMNSPVSNGHEYTPATPPPAPFHDTVEDMASPAPAEPAEQATLNPDDINAESDPTEETERERRQAEAMAPDPNGPMWMD